MPVFELFSNRNKQRKKSGTADVYVYDKIPESLRVQLQQIFRDAVGSYYNFTGNEFHRPSNNNDAWEFIHKTLCREYGVHRLTHENDSFSDIMETIATTTDVERILDIFELIARYLERVAVTFAPHTKQQFGIRQDSEDAIEELNFRFRAASVGFQYENGQVVRLDSRYIHDEVVKPALTLLSQPGFEGPQEEFLQAHRYYRTGEHKDAVNWANKAFESTMKAICDLKGWPYDAGARASDLIKIIRKQNLWPSYLDGSFDQLIATLASGLPQIRNNAGGGHGEGAKVKETPDYIAGYALHLAAAKIVLLINAAAIQKRRR